MVSLVKLGGKLGALEVDQHLQQEVEASVRHVALGVAEGPDDRVDHKLQLRRRHRKECREAVVCDRAQQAEELQPVLWMVLQQVGMGFPDKDCC